MTNIVAWVEGAILLAVVALAMTIGHHLGYSSEHTARVLEVAGLNQRNAELETEKANALTQIAGFAQERQAAVARQSDDLAAAVAANDAKWQGVLHAKQAENARLRADYDRGAMRVRVAANCAPSAPDRPSGHGLPAPTGAGRVVDGPTVELSDAAGRNVLDIRTGIVDDQTKLLACQAHAAEVERVLGAKTK